MMLRAWKPLKISLPAGAESSTGAGTMTLFVIKRGIIFKMY